VKRAPQVRDAVSFENQTYTIVAWQVAPVVGLVLRPLGALDAEQDRIVDAGMWRRCCWNGEQWTAP